MVVGDYNDLVLEAGTLALGAHFADCHGAYGLIGATKLSIHYQYITGYFS